MIRLLLDQGLPRSAANLLRNLGIDTEHVGERGMSGASDASILEYARETNRVICTLDADFHAILALSGKPGPSVIRIRREGIQAAAMAALLAEIVSGQDRALTRGAVVSVTERAVRIRHLPIL